MEIDQKSKINFLYPFSYNPHFCQKIVENINELEWEGRNSNYKVWQPYEITKLPDIALLPSVSKFLDPESESPYFNAGAWILSSQSLNSVKSGLGAEKVVWIYNALRKKFTIKILEIHIYLFKTGIGFLGIQITLPESFDSDTWLDFIHSFRFSSGPRAKGNFLNGYRSDTKEPFFPSILGELISDDVSGFETKDLIECLLSAINCNTNNHEKWWTDIYTKDYLIPYFFISSSVNDEDEKDSFLYRIDSFLNSNSYVLMDEQSQLFSKHRLLYLWKDQCFIFNIEGGGFVSFNTPSSDFFLHVLPDHIVKHYYILYLTVLQQKFFIFFLSERIADVWLKGRELISDSEKYFAYLQHSFKNLQDMLLTFASIGNYSQIMYSQHHHDVYQKWREIQGIDQIYEEIKSEIEYMFNYISVENEKIQQKFNKRLEIVVQGISTIIAFPVFALTVLDISYPELPSRDVWTTIITWTLIGAIVFVLIQFFNKSKENSNKFKE
jgi:hypothetical protein